MRAPFVAAHFARAAPRLACVMARIWRSKNAPYMRGAAHRANVSRWRRCCARCRRAHSSAIA